MNFSESQKEFFNDIHKVINNIGDTYITVVSWDGKRNTFCPKDTNCKFKVGQIIMAHREEYGTKLRHMSPIEIFRFRKYTENKKYSLTKYRGSSIVRTLKD